MSAIEQAYIDSRAAAMEYANHVMCERLECNLMQLPYRLAISLPARIQWNKLVDEWIEENFFEN